MATKVIAEFIFTEDDFESLSFEKRGSIIDGFLKHPEWDVEIIKVETCEVD